MRPIGRCLRQRTCSTDSIKFNLSYGAGFIARVLFGLEQRDCQKQLLEAAHTPSGHKKTYNGVLWLQTRGDRQQPAKPCPRDECLYTRKAEAAPRDARAQEKQNPKAPRKCLWPHRQGIVRNDRARGDRVLRRRGNRRLRRVLPRRGAASAPPRELGTVGRKSSGGLTSRSPRGPGFLRGRRQGRQRRRHRPPRPPRRDRPPTNTSRGSNTAGARSRRAAPGRAARAGPCVVGTSRRWPRTTRQSRDATAAGSR